MSKQIDERVVSMQFDNGRFEKNVATSMSTLDKLKQKLNFSGASKGLENVEAAANKVSFSGLSNSIDTVNAKFSYLQATVQHQLNNMVDSAVAAGKRIVSALTIDPVKTGFQEYETQINAIQTILANTQKEGTTVKQVNAALDELNYYADMTIYNFTEMTRNIGTFTAAGVDLKTSVSAIQGIANLAAVSGSTSLQASTAMYQLSQALAAGKVSLMDWNSVVNAGMGGQVFQDALKETSTLLKTGAEEAIEANGSFRESLQEGWLTAEVLTETLKKFTTSGANEYVAKYTGLSTEAVAAAIKAAEAQYGEADAIEYASKALAEKSGKNADEIKSILEMAKTAQDAATKVKTFSQLWDTIKEAVQSGWGQTWRLIIGDFEEAKELLTELSDFFSGIINKMSDFRNTLLKGALSNPFTDLLNKLDNSSVGKVADKIDSVTTSLEKYQKVVNDVWRGDYKNSDTGRFDLLEEAGYNHKVVQDLVNKGYQYKLTVEDVTASEKKFGVSVSDTSESVKKASSSIEGLTDEQLKNAGLTEEEIRMYRDLEEQAKKTGKSMTELADEMNKTSGRTLLIESFRNAGKGLVTIINAIKDAWLEVFPPMTSVQLYNIIKAINEFSKKLIMSKENADKLKRTFKGLFAILDIIGKIVGGVLKAAFTILGNILKVIFGDTEHNVLDLTASVGDAIVKFRDWLTTNNMITKALQKVVDVCTRCVKAVVGWIKSFIELPIVQKNIEKLKDVFSTTFKSITEWFDKLKTSDNIPRDILLGLVNGLKSGAILVWNAMVEIGKTVLEAIKNVLGIHSPSTETYKIGENTIAGFVNAIKDGLKKVGEVCAKLFDVVKEKLGEVNWRNVFAIGIVVAVGLFVKKFLDILDKFAGPFEAVTKLVEGFAGIGKSISNVFNSLALSLKSKALLNAAIAIGVLAASIALLTFVDQDKIWTSVLALGALAAVLAGLTFAIGFMVKWAGKEKGGAGAMAAIAAFLVSFGVAMLLLAWCVKIVSNIPSDGLKNGMEVLGLFAGMVAVLVAVSAIAGEHAKKAGSMILKISVAMLILLAVAKIAASITDDDMKRGTQAIASFAGMVVALIAVSSLAGKNAKKVGSMILKISVAMLILLAVAKISASIPPEDMERGTKSILAFAGMIVALIAVSLLAGKNAGKAGSLILKTSVALLILVATAKIAAGIPSEEMERGTKSILAFEGMIAALIAVSLLAGKNANKAGNMILKISVALLLMTGVIAILSLLDPDGLGRATTAIAVLLACMIAIVAVTKIANDAKGTVIALTVAVAAIAGAIWILSAISWDKLLPAAVALGAVLLTLAAALWITGKSSGDIKLSSLIAMIAAVAVIAGALWILQDAPWQTLLASAVAMSAVLFAMVGALKLMDYVKGSLTSAGSLLILSVGLIAMAGALLILSKIPAGPLFIAVGAIAALLAVLVGFSALAGLVIPGIAALSGILLSFAAVIIAFGVAALAFAASIYIIAKALPSLADGLTHLVKSLAGVKEYAGDFFVTMLAVAGGLALFGVAAIIAAAGVVILAAGFLIIGAAALLFAAAFALIAITLPLAAKGLTALGDAVAYVAGYKNQADAFLEVMLKLAAGIALVGAALIVVGIGAIVLGVGVLVLAVALIVAGAAAIVFALGIAAVSLALLAVAAVMPILVSAVSNCKDQMDGFASVMLTVGASILAALVLVAIGLAAVGVGAIIAAAGVVVLAAGLLIGSLAVLVLAGSLALLGLSLGYVGDGLLTLWMIIKAIAGDLLGIAEQAWEGASNFVAGFTQGISDKISSAVSAVKDFCDTVVGKIKEFLGIHSPSTVTAEIGANTVAGLVKGINDSTPEAEKAIQGTTKAVSSEMAKGLEGTDAVLYDLTNALTELVNTLKESGSSAGLGFSSGLGDGIKDAPEKIKNLFASGSGSDLDVTGIFGKLGSDGGAEFLNELNAKMSNGEGGINEITDKLGIEIPEQFKNLGSASGEAATEGFQTTWDPDQLQAMLTGEGGLDFSSITSMAGQAGTDSGMNLTTNFVDSVDLNEIYASGASAMQAFADGANSRSSAAEEIFTKTINAIKKDVDRLGTNFNDSGKVLIDSLGSGTKEAANSLSTSVKELIDSILTIMKDAASDSNNAGKTLITKFIEGINVKKEAASEAFSKIISKALDGIKSYYSSFRTAGSNLAEGFADGLSDSTFKVSLKAKAMAKAAVDAAKAELKEHSPSKVFYSIGEYAGEGLVNALDEYTTRAYQAGSEIGSEATIGLQNAIAKISDVVNSDIDAQPTIRPVIDLDDVTAGANAINSMFGMTPSVGVLSNVGAISNMMNTRQNGVNDDVISAIKELGGKVGRGGDVYNVNGITYDDGSNISDAVQSLIRAARIERRT